MNRNIQSGISYAKFKHNKLKNTGMLFEFLLRQVTVDVLNKKKTSKVQLSKKDLTKTPKLEKNSVYIIYY